MEINAKIDLVDGGRENEIIVAAMLQLQPEKYNATATTFQFLMITKLEYQISIKNYQKKYGLPVRSRLINIGLNYPLLRVCSEINC